MRLVAIAAAFLLLVGLPGAQAQDSASPLTRVLVLGDAIGGGLGAGLTRMAEATGRYEVSIRLNEESGMARPEVYDWTASVAKILGSKAYDVIVVMLGANDTQPIRQDGVRIPTGTPEWAEAYGGRIDGLLSELQASGARIIWVGPPPMRDPEYDAAIRDIAEIQRRRAEAKGVAFIDMRPELSGPDGAYAETGPDDTGTVRRLRGRDGISFYKAGNNRMGQIVLAAIESGASGAPAGQAGGEASAASQEEARQVPVFGQALIDGGIYTVQPEGVTANAVMLTAAGLDPRAALKALRDLSPDGSNARTLFRYGHVPPAPTGRADDFAAPAPAPEE
jgi:hypothetical protein